MLLLHNLGVTTDSHLHAYECMNVCMYDSTSMNKQSDVTSSNMGNNKNSNNNDMNRQMELCRAAYQRYITQGGPEEAGVATCSTEHRYNNSNIPPEKQQYSTTIVRKSTTDIWNDHIIDLQNFKIQHGHCRVPRHFIQNPKLGRWVMNVRSHYQFLQKGRKSSLITAKRLVQLQTIDFDFCPKNKSHTKYYIDRWVLHLTELKQFKKENGHCRVPQRYKENKKLGGWVLYVRHQYRKFRNGQGSSTMTHDRINELKRLDFDFEPRKGRPGRSGSGVYDNDKLYEAAVQNDGGGGDESYEADEHVGDGGDEES
jgi:hypothetical protein